MQRTIFVGGRSIGLEALGPPLDSGFDEFYSAYMGSGLLRMDQFTEATLQYFDAHPQPNGKHCAYFSNFTVAWRELLERGRYDEAERVWEISLGPARMWERSRSQRIHKGTPYYFLAVTLLCKGDIDAGYLLAHQALEEDELSSGCDSPDSPAYALVSLNYEKVDQFFRQWVLEQAQFLDERLADYVSTHARELSLER